MIIPNLAVCDVKASVIFYQEKLNFTLVMNVNSNREFSSTKLVDEPVFAILEYQGQQLMVQSAKNLAMELPGFVPANPLVPAGTIYLREMDPSDFIANFNPDEIVKGPEVSWYGMNELYVRDPDGHFLCLAAQNGPAPS